MISSINCKCVTLEGLAFAIILSKVICSRIFSVLYFWLINKQNEFCAEIGKE